MNFILSASLTHSLFGYLSPLHSAIVRGSTALVAVLLEAGADPAMMEFGGLTPLMLAARGGHVKIIEMLHLHGAGE